MRLRHLGYVGQNLTLGLTTGRTLRLGNLTPERVREVMGANLDALRTILAWNVGHDIRFFRIASSFVPFASHDAFQLDWRGEFAEDLAEVRGYVGRHGLRLSTHPGQYTVLNSPHEGVVANAMAELSYHADLMEALDPVSGTITLHVGGVYGDKPGALRAFVAGAERLPPAALRRLTVENDDRLFDVDDVLAVARELPVPVVFDFFHHGCNHRRSDAGDDLPALLEAVVETWGGRVPKFHLSSARAPGGTHHADYVTEQDFDRVVAIMGGLASDAPYDLMLEAKAKEGAVVRLLSAAGRRG